MNIKKLFKNSKAMTLIEILLVVSLISGVGFAIYQSLNNGLKVWSRAQALSSEEDITIFFDKIAQELRNTYFFTKIIHSGDSYRIAFPTIINLRQSNENGDEDYSEQLGRVEYYFDSYSKTIYKRKANYSLSLDNDYFDPIIVLTNVEDLKFEYIYLTENEEIITDVTYDALPIAINIKISVLNPLGTRTLEKYIELPLNS